MRLIAYCSRCHKQTQVRDLVRDGMCPFCLIDEVIAPLKAEYQRLWAKRRRYIESGVSVRNCERQLTTVATRLGDKIHARIGPDLAIGIINGHLEEARNLVERGVSQPRILLPRLATA